MRGWGRAAVNINSHVHRNIVRVSIVVEVHEVINWAHCNDYLSNGVDNGQRHNCPVLKEVKRIQVNCTRAIHFLRQCEKASASNFQKPSHDSPCFSNWDNYLINLCKAEPAEEFVPQHVSTERSFGCENLGRQKICSFFQLFERLSVYCCLATEVMTCIFK